MGNVDTKDLNDLTCGLNDFEVSLAEESYTEINKIVNYALDLVSDFSNSIPLIGFTYDFKSRMEVTMIKPPKGIYAPYVRILTFPRGILLTSYDLNDFEPSKAKITGIPKPKLAIEVFYKQDDNEDSDSKINKYPNIDKEMNVSDFISFVDACREKSK